jgi:hypothetical protein
MLSRLLPKEADMSERTLILLSWVLTGAAFYAAIRSMPGSIETPLSWAQALFAVGLLLSSLGLLCFSLAATLFTLPALFDDEGREELGELIAGPYAVLEHAPRAPRINVPGE